MLSGCILGASIAIWSRIKSEFSISRQTPLSQIIVNKASRQSKSQIIVNKVSRQSLPRHGEHVHV